MAHLIDKDAVVAKIRGYINNAEAFLKYHHNRNDKSVYAFEQEKLVMCELLSFIDTLEVKEVDLEKELSYEDYKSFFEKYPDLSDDWGFDEVWLCAKHFFELGLKAQKGKEV